MTDLAEFERLVDEYRSAPVRDYIAARDALVAAFRAQAGICLDCIEQFVGWLKRWRPVIRRYRRTGKMYVRPSEMTKRAA